MKVSYYPGCTLKTRAKEFEGSAIASMATFGIELDELPSWNCCGAVYSLADDDLIHQLAPVRILIRVMEQGYDKVVTLCSMCYNTLARANLLMRNDEVKKKTINLFMDEEPEYNGEVEVVHFLSFLRDEIGWETVRENIQVPLTGTKVAPYYGCTLQRPRQVGIEPPGSFELMTEFLKALGATVIDFPGVDLCCGSYQTLTNDECIKDNASKILGWAEKAGANALALSCPLCEFNLLKFQINLVERNSISRPMPIFYFTQLLAVALGLSSQIENLEMPGRAFVQLTKKRRVAK